jgi:hypothetical protein
MDVHRERLSSSKAHRRFVEGAKKALQWMAVPLLAFPRFPQR